MQVQARLWVLSEWAVRLAVNLEAADAPGKAVMSLYPPRQRPPQLLLDYASLRRMLVYGRAVSKDFAVVLLLLLLLKRAAELVETQY